MIKDPHIKEEPFEIGFEKALTAGATPHKPFLDRMKNLFAGMDEKYHQVSYQYGFLCQGCEDNCCRTTFFHHTILEYLYLLEGFKKLGNNVQAAILEQAQAISLKLSAGLFCPLCQEGRCLLYAYRPMICRLHGIPHELHRPDQVVIYGPGCAIFSAVAKGKRYIVFDRTEFYRELSGLEQEARAALGLTPKIKMNISQMVVSFSNRSSP